MICVSRIYSLCPRNCLMYVQKNLQCGDFLPFSSLEFKSMDAKSEVCGFE